MTGNESRRSMASQPIRYAHAALLAISLHLPATALAAEPAAPGQSEGESQAPDVMAPSPIAADAIKFTPGKGLQFKTDDGKFSLTLKLRAQILYELDSEEDEGEHVLTESMLIRRARLAFSGNVFDPSLKYKMELGLSPRDLSVRNGAVGQTPLLDWMVSWERFKYATLVAGQFKVSYNRQRIISSGNLQFVDRSIVQGEFNLDRDIGMELRAKEALGGFLRYYAGAYIGEGRGAFEMLEPGHMYLGRVDLLPFGDFEDYVITDFERERRVRMSVGLAYAYLQKARRDAGILGSRPADGGTTNFHNATADVLLKYSGISLLAEAYWREGKRNPGGAVDETGGAIPVEAARNGYGFFAQAGYLLPGMPLEFGARYGQLRPSRGETSLEAENELGAVVSYYFVENAIKLQADYFRLWADEGPGVGDDQVRLQLELGF